MRVFPKPPPKKNRKTSHPRNSQAFQALPEDQLLRVLNLKRAEGPSFGAEGLPGTQNGAPKRGLACLPTWFGQNIHLLVWFLPTTSTRKRKDPKNVSNSRTECGRNKEPSPPSSFLGSDSQPHTFIVEHVKLEFPQIPHHHQACISLKKHRVPQACLWKTPVSATK